ncbi:MAG: flavodoxin-dependent (E)-4-hydroxy-3-methylbut-2-enyl-diphosphate synthase [Candidatus Cloacimonetes bacterium]|nr:flavodoxin-dependent (E)-4-hydroxy-3-methylbut-2-enyl-diphosphate synthase [Candidatus Cloacimonadota bacterium]
MSGRKDLLTPRRHTRRILLGDVPIGAGSPISIQSMTNTSDTAATIAQIEALAAAGCDIVRVAVPDMGVAEALPRILAAAPVPIIADIHFDHKLALASLVAGVHGLRLNPGNIGGADKVREVVAAARERQVPIRIGVNAGSLDKHLLQRYGVTPQALVESALAHVKLLENAGYHEMKLSVKASNVPLTVAAYRLLAQRVDYPLHLGVTEAGTAYQGIIKSAVGIGTLLAEGIGDTIRVSLTGDPLQEAPAARGILRSLGLRSGLEIIACPTCGRTQIDLVRLTNAVEARLTPWRDVDITVAVMGCVVNGPGEAREADYGIAGGSGEGLLFRRGEIVAKVPESQLVDALLELIEAHTPAP